MKWWLVFLIFIISNTLFSKDINELEEFADKYLDIFQDKLSYKNFKMVLDVNDSEIVIDKKYGTFKYQFHEFKFGDGEMIIEKNFDKINFQLFNNSGNPVLSLNYQISLD